METKSIKRIDKLFLSALGVVVENTQKVSGVVCDTREMIGGEIFCCISGENYDGVEFAEEAIGKGALCLVAEKQIAVESDILQVQVSDVRQVMAYLACEFYGHPSRDLSTIGVTGTNGKTTVVNLIAQISSEATEAIGTLSAHNDLTTPNSPQLQSQLASYVGGGIKVVAMEVSSHALAQHRTEGIKFSLAIFLNLSQDHLDYHKNLKGYFAQKAKLFERGRAEIVILCTDSKWGKKLLSQRSDAITFNSQDIDIHSSNEMSSTFFWKGRECTINLPGKHNVLNAVAALECLKALGQDMDKCVEKLRSVEPIRGRFEIVAGQKSEATVIVDYAHTPNALNIALGSARELIAQNGNAQPVSKQPVSESSKIVLVFGCGGDRDKSKRSKMGKIAAKFADVIILTSDNSRSEDTQEIVNDIIAGIKAKDVNLQTELNRREAIKLAISIAEANDVILIAGKGHETTQTTKHGVEHFNDVEVVEELLGRKG